MRLSTVSRRSITTAASQALRAKPLRPNGLSIARVARRGYADAAAPSPVPKPKKRFRALRWAWRLTWLSALGLTGAMAYSIYELRHPEEQYEPDPIKKTLVILGMFRGDDGRQLGHLADLGGIDSLTQFPVQVPAGVPSPC